MTLVRYINPFRSPALAQSPFARSPWSGLESEIERLFETAVSDFGAAASGRFPVDLYEDQDNIFVRAELPGVNREDINVEMVENYLSVAATRKVPAAEGKGEEAVSLSRSVTINADVQADKVAAVYENGVLTVTLPKREEAKPKKVTVAVR